MVGWYHWLDGHEFEQALEVGGGQGILACCSPLSCKVSDTTELLNWTESSFTCISTIIFICLVSVLFSVYLSMADKLHTLWMLQLIFITFCILNLNSTYDIDIQARVLEWVAISFSRRSFWSRDWTHISYISCVGRKDLSHQCHLGSSTWALFVVCAQSCPVLCHPMHCRTSAPLSMGFSRQEYWSRLPFPTPGDLPDPGKYKMW